MDSCDVILGENKLDGDHTGNLNKLAEIHAYHRCYVSVKRLNSALKMQYFEHKQAKSVPI
jgi:hypothetical protein